MFFIVTSNTLDSHQNITFMLILYSMNMHDRCPYLISFKCNFFFKVEVHSTQLEIESAFKKKSHVNMTFSRILCLVMTQVLMLQNILCKVEASIINRIREFAFV